MGYKKFFEPKDNIFLIKLAKSILPLALKFIYKIEKIEIDNNDIEKLKDLKYKRVILCPNHPTALDPIIMFYLSKAIDHNFNYLAAWDIVVEEPLKGYFMQQLGAYSIIRGTIDNDSFKTTIKLITEGKKFLVIFPEGDTCGLNDYLLPFQPGVIQLAFWALDELHKNNQEKINDLFIIPIAIKYKYIKSMKNEIISALKRIEEKLGLYSIENEKKDNYERLIRISEHLLSIAEKFYNLKLEENLSFNDRLNRIKEFIINKISTYLDIKIKPNMNLLDKVRTIFNTINSIIYVDNNLETDLSEYEKKLYKEKKEELKNFYDDLHRVWKFIAVYEGYVKEDMSDERFLEIIKRIEWEIFGKEKVYGPLKVILKIGGKINLLNYYEEYKKNKRNCIENLIKKVEDNIKEMLKKLK